MPSRTVPACGRFSRMNETAELRSRLQELVDGVAAEGGRELPSLRDLAARFEVAPNTIKKLLLELDGDVRVFPVHGRGFFLRLPGDPEPGAIADDLSSREDEHEDVSDPAPVDVDIDVDESYSPVPEEGRRARQEWHSGRDCVVVIGQIVRAIDPTGAPSNQFLQFVQIREHLQSLGCRLS